MQELYTELEIDSSLPPEEVLKTLKKLRKKWSLRLNTADLDKRQEAERKVLLIDKLETSLSEAGTPENLPKEEPKKEKPKKEEPKKEEKKSPDKELTSKLRRIQHFIDMANYDQALEVVDDALKIMPDSPELYAWKGNIYHIIQQDHLAFKAYRSAYEKENSSKYQAMTLLTGSLAQFSDLESFQQGLDDSIYSYVAQGEYAILSYDYATAFDFAEKACALDNTDPDTLVLTLKSMHGLKLPVEQYDGIHKLIRKQPENERLIKAQLKVLMQQKNYKECEKISKKVRMNNPNSTLSKHCEELLRSIKKRERVGEQRKADDKNSNVVKTANIEEAMAQLEVLTGLDNVKEQLQKLRKKVEYDKQRQEMLGIQEVDNDTSYHFVFSGNPGTGKTTVARLFSEVFYHLGILEKGHLEETDRSGLVGQFIGETAQKTAAIIKKSLGGVLFIDEAYALMGSSENDFGKEAIEVLVKAVEDHRRDFIVILAGYKDDMRDLMEMNSGLASRFTKYIDFEDYNEEQLLEIAVNIAEKQKYTMDESGKRAFKQCIQRQMVDSKFGNARAVRNLMNEAFEEKANTDYVGDLTMEELTTITALDFGVDDSQTPEKRAEEYLHQLHSLTGLTSVKEDIESLINFIAFQKEEQERIGAEVSNISMHMVFAGNPGTGKTTVARLYGNLLREMGILKQGQFIEVTRSDLVGQYQGKTAPLVKKACERAYGGILFVDEAYDLCHSQGDSFGHEAVNTLIKEMEDNRDRLVVILAGYTGNMEEFLESNPGFGSRISKTLIFSDYSTAELWEIMQFYAKSEMLELDPDCESIVCGKLEKLILSSGTNFGNARDVRKMMDKAKMTMIMRVQREKVTGDDRRKLLPDDFK